MNFHSCVAVKVHVHREAKETQHVTLNWLEWFCSNKAFHEMRYCLCPENYSKCPERHEYPRPAPLFNLFWFYQRGITPEREITRSRKKKCQLLFSEESIYKISKPYHAWFLTNERTTRCTGLSWPLGSLTPGGQDTRGQLDPRGLKFPGVSSPPPWLSSPPGVKIPWPGHLDPRPFFIFWILKLIIPLWQQRVRSFWQILLKNTQLPVLLVK